MVRLTMSVKVEFLKQIGKELVQQYQENKSSQNGPCTSILPSVSTIMKILDYKYKYKYTHTLGKLRPSVKWNHYSYSSFENEEYYYKAKILHGIKISLFYTFQTTHIQIKISCLFHLILLLYIDTLSKMVTLQQLKSIINGHVFSVHYAYSVAETGHWVASFQLRNLNKKACNKYFTHIFAKTL